MWHVTDSIYSERIERCQAPHHPSRIRITISRRDAGYGLVGIIGLGRWFEIACRLWASVRPQAHNHSCLLELPRNFP